MRIDEFEKISRHNLGREEIDLDLERSWQDLEKRLESEMPVRSRWNRGSAWSLSLLGALLITYCVSDGALWFSPFMFDQSEATAMGEKHSKVPSLVKQDLLSLSSEVPSRDIESKKRASSRMVPTAGTPSTPPPAQHLHVISNEGPLYTMEGSIDQKFGVKPFRERLPTLINTSDLGQRDEKDKGGHADWNRRKINPLPDRLSASTIPLPIVSASLSTGGRATSPGIRHQRRRLISDVQLSLGASHVMGQYYSNSAENGTYVDLLNRTIKNLESVSAAALLGVDLVPGFSLRSGFRFQQLKEVLEINLVSDVERTIENALVEIRINPYTMDSTFVHGTVVQKGQSYKSIRHYNSMNIWSVPLKFEYLPKHDRWGFGMSAGLLFSVSQSKRGRFLQLDGSVSEVETRHPKGIHFLTIEPIFSLKLGSPLSIEARPYFQRAFERKPEAHSISRSQTLLGLDVSLRYDLTTIGR